MYTYFQNFNQILKAEIYNKIMTEKYVCFIVKQLATCTYSPIKMYGQSGKFPYL